MARTRRIHLLCNAHLDPVWLWEWPEGAGEALSTFRVAAGFAETRPDFVFNHNEAILYRWIEEYEPELLRRIRSLVRRRRWVILGGWHVQPDCNMPSGESFVRQILLGKRWFLKTFGVEPRTAANLDPFGHTRGLVQILARSGYDAYLFCRPDRHFTSLPADDFIWVGYDGSEVLAARAEAHYNSRGGAARGKIEAWIKDHPGRDLDLLLWGIGDHGGGASERDLDDIDALKDSAPKGLEIRHSSAEAYFQELGRRRARLPRHAGDINPWAVGCYTTMRRVKQGHRRLENEIYSAEKMASAASFQGLLKYPAEELGRALEDLAFAEFHDLLPGSSIPPGEEGAVRLLDHGLEICSRVKARAFFALAGGEAPAEDGTIPVFVYNAHPFPVRTIVECEFQGHEPNYDGGFLRPRVYRDGRLVPSQPEKEYCNLSLEWRKRVAFRAELRPFQMNRFTVKLEKMAARPAPPEAPPDGGLIRFKSRDLEVRINASTGLVDSWEARETEVVAPGAFRPVVMADNADPWGMAVTRFREPAGRFVLASPEETARAAGTKAAALPPVRMIEDGPVRSVVEACFTYERSVAVLRYKLPKEGTELEIELRVLWNEKDRMLKLAVPLAWKGAEYRGQVAYGRDALPKDGAEAVAQKWTAVAAPRNGPVLTCINDGIHGSDFDGRELRLSLLRSPAHAADPAAGRAIPCQDRFIPRIDQGEHVFRFWLNAGPARDRWDKIEGEALARNESPYVLAYFPPGRKRKARPFLALSDPAIQVSAAKRAEDGNTLILRLFEPTGRRRTAVLALPFAGAKTKITLAPYEIRTLAWNPRSGKFRKVDLLERPEGRR